MTEPLAGQPIISAHRGSCGIEGLPLRESYDRAIELGVDFIEFDVRRTSDGAFVVHHDPRTIAGHLISEISLDDYREEMRADTLQFGELLELARGRVKLHCDLKEVGYESEVLGRLLDSVDSDAFVITSLEDRSVLTIKEGHPEVRVGLSLGRDLEHTRPWEKAAIRFQELYPRHRVAACHPDFLAVHWRLAQVRVLEFCGRHGLPAWVWTVDEESSIRTLMPDRRVAGIISNQPQLAMRLRDAPPRPTSP